MPSALESAQGGQKMKKVLTTEGTKLGSSPRFDEEGDVATMRHAFRDKNPCDASSLGPKGTTAPQMTLTDR